MLAVVLAVGLLARPSRGPLLRRAPLGPDPVALALDAPAGRLYVADHVDNVVRVIATTTGALVQRLALGRGGPLTVDARSGHLVVADAWNGPDRYGVYADHAFVRVLDGRSGVRLRTVALGVDEDVLALLADVVGTRMGREERVVVVCASVVLVLDARRGVVIQRILAGVQTYAAQAALDPVRGQAFVLTSDAQALDVLDLRRGRLVRTVRVGGYLTALAVDQRTRRVIVADAAQGAVRLLDADTLRRVASVMVGGAPAGLAVDERSGRIVVAATAAGSAHGSGRGGRVLVLDGRTGAVQRTLVVSGAPVLLALDSRTKHIFVGVIDDSGALPHGPWDRLPMWLRHWLPGARPAAQGQIGPTTLQTITLAS